MRAWRGTIAGNSGILVLLPGGDLPMEELTMQSIHGLPIAISLEEACDPRRLALLIYDMQVGICQQVSCGPAITEACRRLRDRCRAAGVPVAYSRHLSLPTHWMGPFQTRMAMAWQRVDDPDAVKPWFLRGAEGFQLVPDLAPTEDEFVFDKLAMSAFEGTPLQFALRDRGITTLAICGIALEIGIEPTVRHATDLGIVPVVVADACGAGNEEAGKRSFDQLRFIGDALITNEATFCAALTASASK
jgi:nicotinamidase-related amidase